MKHLLTAIACCLAVAGGAQFIPQPMEYNPDSNDDSFIGSEDILGALTLFGTPFNNGDSVNIVTLDFRGLSDDTLFIPENADIVYVLDEFKNYNSSTVEQRNLFLPNAESFKSLMVIPEIQQSADEYFNLENPASKIVYSLLFPCEIQEIIGSCSDGWGELSTDAHKTNNLQLSLFFRTRSGNWMFMGY